MSLKRVGGGTDPLFLLLTSGALQLSRGAVSALVRGRADESAARATAGAGCYRERVQGQSSRGRSTPWRPAMSKAVYNWTDIGQREEEEVGQAIHNVSAPRSMKMGTTRSPAL